MRNYLGQQRGRSSTGGMPPADQPASAGRSADDVLRDPRCCAREGELESVPSVLNRKGHLLENDMPYEPADPRRETDEPQRLKRHDAGTMWLWALGIASGIIIVVTLLAIDNRPIARPSESPPASTGSAPSEFPEHQPDPKRTLSGLASDG
jgi:hypothetical protein